LNVYYEAQTEEMARAGKKAIVKNIFVVCLTRIENMNACSLFIACSQFETEDIYLH
jgi:hypothetical protein